MRSSTDPIYIGTDFRTGSPADYYTGKIDQLRMWNDALGQTEVDDDMAGERLSTSLIGEWLFDGEVGVSGQVRDSSGGGRHGTKAGNVQYSTDLPVGEVSGGGFSIPFDIVSQVGGEVTVNNAGDVPSWPVLLLRGPLTSPTVANQTTGAYLQLQNVNLQAGETLVISMAKATILKGSQNYMQYKSSVSEFWPLVPGNNIIAFTDIDYDPQAEMRINYQSANSGI
jgi:hypothetical protein